MLVALLAVSVVEAEVAPWKDCDPVRVSVGSGGADNRAPDQCGAGGNRGRARSLGQGAGSGNWST